MNAERHDLCTDLVRFLLDVNGQAVNAFCYVCDLAHALVERWGVGEVRQVNVSA